MRWGLRALQGAQEPQELLPVHQPWVLALGSAQVDLAEEAGPDSAVQGQALAPALPLLVRRLAGRQEPVEGVHWEQGNQLVHHQEGPVVALPEAPRAYPRVAPVAVAGPASSKVEAACKGLLACRRGPFGEGMGTCAEGEHHMGTA